MRMITAVVLFGGCLSILLACGHTGDSGSGEDEALIEDAVFSAALTDGDGEGLLDSTVSGAQVLAASEEEVESVLGTDEGFARDCSLDGLMERVIAEYDTDGDGKLDRSERKALRREFVPRPLRRHRFARHHRLARLRWIYDADDSRDLDEEERGELRADLEERCENRQAYLLEVYDEDESGTLDEEEWAQIHEDLKARRQARRDAILDEFDADEDGRLDFAERRAAHLALHEALKERRAAVIEEYDEDGDGDLDDDEKAALREALKERVRGGHFGEGDVDPE